MLCGSADLGPHGQVVASISVSGPTSRINAATAPVIAKDVMKAARRVSDNLGAPATVDGWVLPDDR